MSMLDVFSKRGKPAPDVYVYDELPPKLRAQLVHLLEDLAEARTTQYEHLWTWIAKAIAREHGLLDLPETPSGRFEGRNYGIDCLNYVLKAEAAQALDLVELAFRLMQVTDDYRIRRQLTEGDVAEAVAELNHRFRENGCGYQYEAGRIVRVDSQYLHAQVVKPVIDLLSAKGFAGPNKEFLAAHEHFRHGRIEAAITDACKAFESTVKAICDARGWKYEKTAAASALIKVVVEKGLVPKYSDEQLNALQKCLIGIATIRNKDSGHGAGAQPREVPEHYAAYALHLAASNIVFLVECHRAKK